MNIFRTDIPSALKDTLFDENNLEKYIDTVDAVFGELEDSNKFQVFDKNEEYYVHLSQLNNTVYHIEKDTAEEEILKFISLNKKLNL